MSKKKDEKEKRYTIEDGKRVYKKSGIAYTPKENPYGEKDTRFGGKDASTNRNHGAHTKTILRRMLDAPLDEPYEAKTIRAKMCAAQIEQALEGSCAHFKEIVDRVDGKVADEQHVYRSELTPEQVKVLAEQLEKSF